MALSSQINCSCHEGIFISQYEIVVLLEHIYFLYIGGCLFFVLLPTGIFLLICRFFKISFLG